LGGDIGHGSGVHTRAITPPGPSGKGRQGAGGYDDANGPEETPGDGERVMAAQAYCVKCKTKREMKDAVQITMKNGRPATEGKCPQCGTKMFKIGAA